MNIYEVNNIQSISAAESFAALLPRLLLLATIAGLLIVTNWLMFQQHTNTLATPATTHMIGTVAAK